MTPAMRNFAVGLASALALIGLATLLIFFGELEALFHHRYRVTIHTDDGGGLRQGSTVEWRGVPIGLVESVVVEAGAAFPVRIVAMIDEGIRLPGDVQPFASLPLIGSTAVLQLRSTGSNLQPLPDDDSADIAGPLGGGMFSELTEQLDQRMQPLMDSLERFNRLSDTFVNLGENLNSLMLPQTPEQLRGGDPPNLRTAIIRLNQVLDDARLSLELANSFLGDEQLRADAQQAIHKAGELIDQATAAIDRYAQLAQNLQGNADDLVKRLLPVFDSVGSTLEEVRRVVKQANDGKGTVGQLLSNPDLYNSLNDAATRLQRTLIELQTLIEQLKAEGVIINF